jgi:hypothetical protein
MLQTNISRRIVLISTCVVAAVLFFTRPGAADSPSCAGSYVDAQGKEAAGRLLEARGLYLQCARQVCGAFLLSECTIRHARLDVDIPSVVPVATEASGAPRADVEVTLDGKPFAEWLDGRSLQVDPGLHEFVFHTDDGATVSEKVMIVQGDRNRRIAVSVPSKESQAASSVTQAAPPTTASTHEDEGDKPDRHVVRTARSSQTPPRKAASSSHGHAVSWVLSGVSVLGGGGFVLLSAWGKKDNDLLRQCAPSCQQASVDRVKQRYLAADVSLGVGAVALSSALLIYALSGSSSEQPARNESAYSLDVHPTTGAGAVASLKGSF